MFLGDNQTIRIITDKGFDCVFEIQSRYNQITRENQLFLQLQTYTRIQNIEVGNFEHKHAILELDYETPQQVLYRLIRKSQQLKVWQEQCNWKSKKGYIVSQSALKEKRTETIYSVDYTMSDDMITGSESNALQLEMSFTLLDWVILKRIFSVKDFTLDVVDKE